MAGFGKGSRPGRRPSSSSSTSPLFSTASMVVLIAFCLLAVWMLSSSSHSSFGPVSSSHADADSVIHSRASLSSSRSKASPSLFFKEPDEGADRDGGSGGVRETETGEKTAEEKLPPPVLYETMDIGGEGHPLQKERQEESKLESQSKGQPIIDESQKDEEEQQDHQHQTREEEPEPQQEEANKLEKARLTEEDSHLEHLMEGGDDIMNEQGQSHEETGSTREELSGHFGHRGDNDVNHDQLLQEEESVDHRIQKLQEEVQTESSLLQSIGDSDIQQQERVNEVDNGLDGQQLQLQQMPEEGETIENELRADKEQKDSENEQNHGHVARKQEIGDVEDQDQSQQLTGTEESNEKNAGESTVDAGDVFNGTDRLPQQQGINENLSEQPHVTDGAAHSEVVLSDSSNPMTPWSTQASQSHNAEKFKASESRTQGVSVGGNDDIHGQEWKLCNATAGPDYIPCLDNEEALRHMPTKHYEHRERHCPDEAPTCLVPFPEGYKRPIEWPLSRDRIWYYNVPHTKLAAVKGHQNWVKVAGEYLTFPGGGTQFIHGAYHYIDFIQKSVRNIAWGEHTRVVLDVGCGVASFGGYLFEKDVITMSFAPKDEHEAQVQLALERGIPAISAVMGSQRLPFPSKVFDLVHCARCRVPWHAEGGSLLLELNRVLRPGGYFVWSATPVYQKLKEDVEIWKEMSSLTKSMCWDLIVIRKDRVNSVGAAIYHKPLSNDCYDNRRQQMPPMCPEDDDPDTAWYVPLQSCMHRIPPDASERGTRWPEDWPHRLHTPPYWLNNSEVGVYGKSAPFDFTADYEHWKRVVSKSYLHGLGIDWSKVRNVMDMRAVCGGFAAALKDLKIWVMNVVNVDSSDTLPIIYERGLFGIYHDWCESFSTYPRTYDLIHADQLFSNLKKRCSILPTVVEVDRILRPGGKLLLRDEPHIVSEVESILKSLHWEVRLTFNKGREGVLCAEKTDWRPGNFLAPS